MRKKIFFATIVLQVMWCFAQKNMKMYYERKGDTIAYFADNNEIFPVSMEFSEQPVLENMRKPEVFKLIHVLPAKSEKIPITYFVANDKRKAFGIRKMPGYRTYMGDLTIKSYDANFQYDLPFKKDATFNLYQGYNGNFSHQNENSIDFTMPEGTEILAAREGLVIDVVQHNSSGCPTQKCASQGNYIAILHSDGTIAKYFHLKLNGSKVNIGDQIEKGKIIAISGNTGWSSGPHLHFECFLPSNVGPKFTKTVRTLFRTGDGTKAEYLKEKTNYTRNYD